MPASMISAPTGGSPNVIGSSMAMVATEPMPGSTPINVPTSAPIRQNSRFHGVAATENPSARLARRSCMINSLASEPRPQLERQIQQINEQQYGKNGHHDSGNHRLHPSGFRRARARDNERDEGRDDEPERTDRGGEDEDRYGNPERASYGIALEGLSVGEKA